MVFQGGEQSVSIEDIVEITPIKKRIFNRLDGDITGGYNFTKASQVGQFNLGGNVIYRTEKNQLELVINSVITTQETEETTKKQDGAFRWSHFYAERWFWFSSVKLEQNTELAIRRRFILEMGMGRSIVQKRTTLVNLEAGFLGSNEQSTDTISSTNNKCRSI